MPEGFKTPPADGPHAEVWKRAGGMLMPQPPIGQLDTTALIDATREELAQLVTQRFGLSIDTIVLPRDETARVFTKGGTELNHPWTSDELVQLAIMHLDGKSLKEMADAMNLGRVAEEKTVTEQLIASMLSQNMSREVKELAATNSIIRRRHEMLAPMDPQNEAKLSALEKASGLPRQKLFTDPRVWSNTRKMPQRSSKHRKANIWIPEYSIPLLYARFVRKEKAREIAARASLMLGYEVSKDSVAQLLKNVLTPEAKKAFGMQGYKDTE